MEWQVELLKALVEMVKTGGSYALWGIAAWWIFNLLKIGGILCFLGFLVKQFHSLLHLQINRYFNSKDCKQDSERLALLKGLVDTFKSSQEETSGAMKDFLTEAEHLLKKWKDINEVNKKEEK